MHSHIVTVYDRSRFAPGARKLREFELVGQSASCAWRAAAEAASAMPEARDYYVSKG